MWPLLFDDDDIGSGVDLKPAKPPKPPTPEEERAGDDLLATVGWVMFFCNLYLTFYFHHLGNEPAHVVAHASEWVQFEYTIAPMDTWLVGLIAAMGLVFNIPVCQDHHARDLGLDIAIGFTASVIAAAYGSVFYLFGLRDLLHIGVFSGLLIAVVGFVVAGELIGELHVRIQQTTSSNQSLNRKENHHDQTGNRQKISQ